MIRRISTRWVLAVLAAVVVPFLGFAWYVHREIAQRLSGDVVRYYLLNLAADIAEEIDREIAERKLDVASWGDDPLVEWAVGDYGGDEVLFQGPLVRRFDSFVSRGGAFEVIVAVDAKGRFVAGNTVDPAGRPLDPSVQDAMRSFDFSSEPWFEITRRGESANVRVYETPLLPPERQPRNYHVGFAEPVFGQERPDEVVGAVFAILPWERIERIVLDTTRRGYFQGLIGEGMYSSSYAWLWDSDADTILAHPSREIVGKKVSEPPISLPQLVEAARSADWGMYPEYTFRGVRKQAAFRHCAPPERGGFGWVVGIGIDNRDIYSTVDELRTLLVKATLVVLGVVVLWTIAIARRTTRPIEELYRTTQRVAAGDLDARVPVHSSDELGQLAEAFNRMTDELRESRRRLVQVEKEAAWREMARQVAHEIKNPLTPIQLSIRLLKRAREEQSPQFDEILERTIGLVERQVESMRRIADDFQAFAGSHEPRLVPCDLRALVDDVLALETAWAEELGVTVRAEGEGVWARADEADLRRALINLVSNALEAMPDGGELEVRVAREAERAVVLVLDRGEGLSAEAREHLFEPHFTTKSHGTGLGLAVTRRVVEQMEGRVTLEPREGGGTVARVELPLAEPPGAAEEASP